ncbi:hypothetical protein EVAR_64658_1 [Eumeta japonica]|uniref:Uncharacterized protein n=1 Tax=Eumeta variegata TaxID=151549 RepID=A0A4C2A3X0_EUMVA|nr:hypothetical protein EVAR_64658_1 [Eumeta japonica]
MENNPDRFSVIARSRKQVARPHASRARCDPNQRSPFAELASPAPINVHSVAQQNPYLLQARRKELRSKKNMKVEPINSRHNNLIVLYFYFYGNVFRYYFNRVNCLPADVRLKEKSYLATNKPESPVDRDPRRKGQELATASDVQTTASEILCLDFWSHILMAEFRDIDIIGEMSSGSAVSTGVP